MIIGGVHGFRRARRRRETLPDDRVVGDQHRRGRGQASSSVRSAQRLVRASAVTASEGIVMNPWKMPS